MRIALAIVASFASIASAQERPSLTRARTLLNEGDWARAAQELEAEQVATKDSKLLHDVGRAYENAGDFKKAVQFYTRYLEAFPAAENYNEVNRAVLELTPLTFKGAPAPKIDRHPPRIRHEPRKAWPAGEAIVIEAIIDDSTGVFEPTVFYRRGTGAFVPALMTVSGENKYVGLIAPMEVGELHYFVEAFDAKGNGPSRAGSPTYPHTMRVVQPSQLPAEGETLPSPPLPPLVQAPEISAEGGAVEPVSLGPAGAGRGPWAFVAIGAGVLSAGLGTYFGMRAVSASGEWRSALDESTRVAGMDRTRSSATLATITWTAAGLLTAGGGALFFFTNF